MSVSDVSLKEAVASASTLANSTVRTPSGDKGLTELRCRKNVEVRVSVQPVFLCLLLHHAQRARTTIGRGSKVGILLEQRRLS